MSFNDIRSINVAPNLPFVPTSSTGDALVSRNVLVAGTTIKGTNAAGLEIKADSGNIYFSTGDSSSVTGPISRTVHTFETDTTSPTLTISQSSDIWFLITDQHRGGVGPLTITLPTYGSQPGIFFTIIVGLLTGPIYIVLPNAGSNAIQLQTFNAGTFSTGTGTQMTISQDALTGDKIDIIYTRVFGGLVCPRVMAYGQSSIANGITVS